MGPCTQEETSQRVQEHSLDVQGAGICQYSILGILEKTSSSGFESDMVAVSPDTQGLSEVQEDEA